ncbi:hypothetical protein GQR58_028684 [Nymphon striatum]|nr:hypothetical protein GQR58_028684 [Nymphon striatum]
MDIPFQFEPEFTEDENTDRLNDSEEENRKMKKATRKNFLDEMTSFDHVTNTIIDIKITLSTNEKSDEILIERFVLKIWLKSFHQAIMKWYQRDIEDLKLQLNNCKQEEETQMDVINSMKKTLLEKDEKQIKLSESLSEELKSMEKAFSISKNDAEQLEEEISQKDKELNEVKCRLEDEIAELRLQLEQSELTKKDVDDQTNLLIQNKDELINDLQQQITELHDVSKSCDEKTEIILILQSEVKNISNAMEDLKLQLQNKTIEIEESHAETESSKINFDLLLTEANNKVVAFEEKLTNEEYQTEILNNKIFHLDSELKKKDSDLFQITSQIEAYHERNASMESIIKVKETEIKELKMEAKKKLDDNLFKISVLEEQLVNEKTSNSYFSAENNRIINELSEREKNIANKMSQMETMNNELLNLTDEIHQLQNDKISLQNEIDIKTETIQDLSKNITSEDELIEMQKKVDLIDKLNKDIEMLQDRENELQNQVMSVKESAEDKDNLIEKWKQEAMEKDEQLQCKESEILEYNAKIEAALNEKNQLKEVLKEQNDDFLDLQEKLNLAEINLSESQATISNLGASIIDLKSDISDWSKNYNEMKENLSREKEDLISANKLYDKEIGELKNDVLGKSEQIRTMNEILSKASGDNKDLELIQQKLIKNEENVQEFQQKISALNTELEESNSTLKAKDAEISSLSSGLSEIQITLETNFITVSNLENEVFKKVDVITELNDQIEILKNKEILSSETSNRLKEELNTQTQQYSTLMEEKSILFNELQNISSKLGQSMQELEANMKVNQDLEFEVQTVKESHRLLEEKDFKTQTLIENLEAKSAELLQDNKLKNNEISSLNNDKLKMTDDNKNLRLQLERIEFYEQEYKKVVSDLDDVDQEACRVKEELANENNEIRHQLVSVTEKCTTLENNNKFLEIELNKLNDQIAKSEIEKQTLVQDLESEISQKVEELSASNASKESELMGFRESFEKINEENKLLQNQVESLNYQQQENVNETASLKVEVTDTLQNLKKVENERDRNAENLSKIQKNFENFVEKYDVLKLDNDQKIQMLNQLQLDTSQFSEKVQTLELDKQECELQIIQLKQIIDENIKITENISREKIAFEDKTIQLQNQLDQNVSTPSKTETKSFVDPRLNDIQMQLSEQIDFNRKLSAEKEELNQLISAERQLSESLKNELGELQKKPELNNSENISEPKTSEEPSIEESQCGWENDVIEVDLIQELAQGAPANDLGSKEILVELEGKYNNLVLEHDKLKQKNNKMLIKLKLFKSKSDKFLSQVESLKGQNTSLEEKLAEMIQTNSKLQSQADDINKGKFLMSESIDKQALKMQELTKVKNELQKSLTDVQRENSFLQKEVQQERSNLEFSNEENSSLVKELNSVIADNKQLNASYNQMSAEIDTLQKQVQKKNEEVDELVHRLHDEKNYCMDGKEKILQGQLTIEELKQNHQSMSSQIQSIQYENNRLQNHVVTLNKTAERFEPLKCDYDAVCGELDEIKSRLIQVQAQRDEAMNRLGSFEANWSEDESKLYMEIDELKAQISQLSNDNYELTMENRRMIDLTSRQPSESNSNIKQEVAEEINEEIARSDEKLLGAAPTIETDIYPREVELTKRESELDRKISKYENDHREYLDRRRELEIWFNEANERFEHVRISGETMSQQIAQVNDHNQHLQSENGSLSHKLEVLNTKYNDLENSIKNSSTSVAESSELTNLTIERLRAELQRAMESLHHKDRICEELKHTIAEVGINFSLISAFLQEERIISQKFTRKSFNIEEDVHSPPSSLNSTIIDMDESGGNEVKSTELSSTSQPIFVNDEYTEEILERLRLTEKEKLNLQSENMALNDALSMEQRKRYDVEQELKTANEVLNLDFTSQDKSDIFGGTQHTNISSRPLFKAMLQAPLMTPECTTGHQVSKFSLRNSPKPAYGAHIWYHYDFISLNVGTSGLWQ